MTSPLNYARHHPLKTIVSKTPLCLMVRSQYYNCMNLQSSPAHVLLVRT